MSQNVSHTHANDAVIWNTLYSRMILHLPEMADEMVLQGLENLDFKAETAPNLYELANTVKAQTGWDLVLLEDMVDDTEFIFMLANKKYPCRTWLRSQEQLTQGDDEYDMFHDIIGHTPLLYLPEYSQYLTELGAISLQYTEDREILRALKRMYWHSIQFGLRSVDKTIKIYGAHLLTSTGETVYAMSAGVPKYNFDVELMMTTPYVNGKYQEKYFVIDNYKQLLDSIPAIKAAVAKMKK